MSNPDNSSITPAILGGIIFGIGTMILFTIRSNIWVFIGLILFSFCYAMLIQYITYTTCSAGTLALASLPAMGATGLTLLAVHFIRFLRIPIASLFSSSCDCKSSSLEKVEENPSVKASSYGFYSGFAIMFGILSGAFACTKC